MIKGKIKISKGRVIKDFGLKYESKEKDIGFVIEGEDHRKYIMRNGNKYEEIIRSKLCFFTHFMYRFWPADRTLMDEIWLNKVVKFKYIEIKNKNYIVRILEYS